MTGISGISGSVPMRPIAPPERREPKERENTRPEGPENAGGRKEEICVGNTDDVDREIERLKKKKQELLEQLNSRQDPAKAEALKKQLNQVEQELRQKDNDTYRRAHSKFSQLA